MKEEVVQLPSPRGVGGSAMIMRGASALDGRCASSGAPSLSERQYHHYAVMRQSQSQSGSSYRIRVAVRERDCQSGRHRDNRMSTRTLQGGETARSFWHQARAIRYAGEERLRMRYYREKKKDEGGS